MAQPALSEELIEQWADREWRLNNLYFIEDKYGAVTKFKLNPAQKQLLDELHYLNIILKARQLGFSTFILLLALDCCLFNSHFAAGLVADTLDNAKNLLKRVKFAYARIPDEIKRVVPLKSDNQTEMEFGNGSQVSVGVSLRSGTFNFLHVSEYGKICAKFPDKAKEIKSGALNTLAPRQLAFIESTAEGRGGDFYDKTQEARNILDGGRDPEDMEFKFHFFPWFMDLAYSQERPISLTNEDKEYFQSLLDEHSIELTDGQKWWYAAKSREQGEDMWKEFPSTADEAFKAAKEGSYWGKEMRKLRQLKRIGSFPYVPNIQVDTHWDFGLGDTQTIWLRQTVGGMHRFIGYYENSGEALAHYFNWLNQWAARRNAVFGQHWAPHDVENRRQGLETVETIKTMADSVGFYFETVMRSPDKHNSVMNARNKLMQCEFDETECATGILHLEEYSRDWDDKLSVWKSFPRHDEHSHGADAFITFTDGYDAPPDPTPPRRPVKGLV